MDERQKRLTGHERVLIPVADGVYAKLGLDNTTCSLADAVSLTENGFYCKCW